MTDADRRFLEHIRDAVLAAARERFPEMSDIMHSDIAGRVARRAEDLMVRLKR